jgi:hypothetical protein
MKAIPNPALERPLSAAGGFSRVAPKPRPFDPLFGKLDRTPEQKTAILRQYYD